MIRVKRANGLAVPELCCDVCLLPIEVISLGMAIWFEAIDHEEDTTNLYIVHKGACDKCLVADKQGDAYGGWHELDYSFALFMETARLKP